MKKLKGVIKSQNQDKIKNYDKKLNLNKKFKDELK